MIILTIVAIVTLKALDAIVELAKLLLWAVFAILSLPFSLLGSHDSDIKVKAKKGKRGWNGVHPFVIDDNVDGHYEGYSLTHNGDYGNVPLSKNPNPQDDRQSYARPYKYKAKDSDLHKEELEGWRMPQRDLDRLRGLPSTDKTPNLTYKKDGRNRRRHK